MTRIITESDKSTKRNEIFIGEKLDLTIVENLGTLPDVGPATAVTLRDTDDFK
jgi:hypothetical protein